MERGLISYIAIIIATILVINFIRQAVSGHVYWRDNFGYILFLIIFSTVALFPDVVDILLSPFEISTLPMGRIVLLLCFSVIFLLVGYFYERFKFDDLKNKLDTYFVSESIRMSGVITTEEENIDLMIIIPAFNEGENIGIVVKEVIKTAKSQFKQLSTMVLVIDDGSSDNTAEIAEESGAKVVSCVLNRGGGAAIRTGLAAGNRLKCKYLVTMDADGQHRAEDLPILLAPLLKEDAKDRGLMLIIGSRLKGSFERVSFLRHYGLYLFNLLLTITTGKKIEDCASGFRAFDAKLVQNLRLTQDQYHTTEMIIEVARKKFEIIEVPIVIKKRLSGQSKKGVDLKYGLLFLRSITKSLFR